MGIEINKLALEPPSRPTATMITSTTFRTHGYRPIDSVEPDTEMDVLRLNHRSGGDDDSDVEDSSSTIESPSTGELAGIYLGVLNVYTTLPQFVGTFISWIVFSILEPGTPPVGQKPPTTTDEHIRETSSGGARDGGWMNLDTDAPNAIAVCLFIGALSALVAAEATRRFRALRQQTNYD
jgi:solute carrier family 45 protein 1/2/4